MANNKDNNSAARNTGNVKNKKNGRGQTDKHIEMNAVPGKVKSALNGETGHFICGLICLMFGVYMFLAFSSFLFTGGADQSLLAYPDAETGHSIQNHTGPAGARLAEFLINGCFGIPAYLIVVVCLIAGTKLMKAYNFKVWKWFLGCMALMLWLSLTFGFALTGLFDNSFIYPGGLHGYNVSRLIISYIGTPGLILFLLAWAIIMGVILRKETMNFVRKVLHPDFVKKNGSNVTLPVDDQAGSDSAGNDYSAANVAAGNSAEGASFKADNQPAGNAGTEPDSETNANNGVDGNSDNSESDGNSNDGSQVKEKKFWFKKPGGLIGKWFFGKSNDDNGTDNEADNETVKDSGKNSGNAEVNKDKDINLNDSDNGNGNKSSNAIDNACSAQETNYRKNSEMPEDLDEELYVNDNDNDDDELISKNSLNGGHFNHNNYHNSNFNDNRYTDSEADDLAPNAIELDINVPEAGLHSGSMGGSMASQANLSQSGKAMPANSGEPVFEIEETKQEEKVARGDLNVPYNPRLDLELYKFPTLDLLKTYPDDGPSIDMEEQNANKNRIIQVLRSFGIEISSIKANVGPTVTLYEITPAEGVRISKIRNLEDDIALSLSALGIRIIAPIPGKGTIGIEVPNASPKIVPMSSVLASKKFQETTFDLPIALGKTITNEVFMVDLAKAPHMLVAGATGQGKSVGLNAIVTSLLYKKHPSELKFVIIDPKKVEFAIYAPIERHFLAKLPDGEDAIITDVTKVVQTLNSLCLEMDTRYDLLKKAGCRNIKEYNAKFINRQLNPENGHKFMPYIVIIIDEFGDLIMTAGKEVELPICRIAQLARAVGIHAIIATQRPTTNIITGTIKANFPARVAFRVASMMDSRTILDRPGAQQLIGKGDMLYLQGNDPVRVQCAFVDTPEVEKIAEYISRQQGYPTAFMLPEFVDENADSGSAAEVDMNRLDPMFEEAARLLIYHQQGSTSLIQRKLSLGYNRAGRIMDQLERAGIVGPANGSKAREVLCLDENDLQMRLSALRNQ